MGPSGDLTWNDPKLCRVLLTSRNIGLSRSICTEMLSNTA